MLVRFQCKAYADLIFFGDVAIQLLHMMNHSGVIPGAIKAQDLPVALDALKKALAVSNAEAAEGDVALRHRALPLINMLLAAIEASCDVVFTS